MSEEPQGTSSPQPGTAEPTAGMLLRKAREATGLHVAALAVAIKVPVKKLEALEADRLHEMADAVFVRALAGSVCRALRIDPAPVLSKLPQSVLPKLGRDEPGVNMPFRSGGVHRYGNSVISLVSRPAALWVLGLLLAALVVLYFPEVRTGADNAAVPMATVSVEAAAPASSPAMAQMPLAPPAGIAGVAPQDTASASAPPAQATPEGVAREAGPAPAAAVDVLVFKAKSTAWVRVSDARGAIQFEKTLAAGETAAASGTMPLAIVVGNVSATELMVRGQPFNLEEVAKNNVARFEVK